MYRGTLRCAGSEASAGDRWQSVLFTDDEATLQSEAPRAAQDQAPQTHRRPACCTLSLHFERSGALACPTLACRGAHYTSLNQAARTADQHVRMVDEGRVVQGRGGGGSHGEAQLQGQRPATAAR